MPQCRRCQSDEITYIMIQPETNTMEGECNECGEIWEFKSKY